MMEWFLLCLCIDNKEPIMAHEYKSVEHCFRKSKSKLVELWLTIIKRNTCFLIPHNYAKNNVPKWYAW